MVSLGSLLLGRNKIHIIYFFDIFSLRDKEYGISGDGIPALYIDNTGILCLYFPMNDYLNMASCSTRKVEIKTWNNLVISSVMENLQVRLFEIVHGLPSVLGGGVVTHVC